MITGISSIQCFRFIRANTSNPSITGMLISKRRRAIPVPYCFSRLMHSSPFAASNIRYSSFRISARISQFIWESSTIRICCRSLASALSIPDFSVTIIFFRFFAWYIRPSARATALSMVSLSARTPPILTVRRSLAYPGTSASQTISLICFNFFEKISSSTS